MPFGSEIPLFAGAPQASYQSDPAWAQLGAMKRKNDYMADVARARQQTDASFKDARAQKVLAPLVAQMKELQSQLSALEAQKSALASPAAPAAEKAPATPNPAKQDDTTDESPLFGDKK